MARESGLLALKVCSSEQEQHFTLLMRTLMPIMLLECSQLTPAVNAVVLATSGATTNEAPSVTDTCSKIWSQASVRSGTMMQLGHVAAAASLKRMSGDADPDEYEEEEQEWVEAADAYCGDDDAWVEDFPQDDVDLEEPFGSLETAEPWKRKMHLLR